MLGSQTTRDCRQCKQKMTVGTYLTRTSFPSRKRPAEENFSFNFVNGRKRDAIASLGFVAVTFISST